MPRIIVIADGPTDRVLHSERVSPSDFETTHFRHQLAERVAWAVGDADTDPASAAAAQAGPGADIAAATPSRARAA